ncbi:RNA methyltransferase [Leptolyngbya sp. AN02str]|uniref:RNA methyltransferase n=1 Tax=Leptolyngbya sp. AN02str TaxID=3423363 RepID=UPI003D317F28
MDGVRQIRVVLVEPAGPLNVGSVARVMKNMGLQQLVLVNPQCDPLGEDARRMAVHGHDVLEAAQIVPSLAIALADCRRVVATTGRDRSSLNLPLDSPRTGLPWLLAPGATTGAIVFGREDSGLTNEELNLAQRWVQIPVSDVYPSMNLAQAVGVCCYELRLACIPVAPSTCATVSPVDSLPDWSQAADLAPREQLEGFYLDLQDLLLSIGYLYPHTASQRMEKIRQLYNRAYPTENDVALLRGMVRQMRWAANQAEPSADRLPGDRNT